VRLKAPNRRDRKENPQGPPRKSAIADWWTVIAGKLPLEAGIFLCLLVCILNGGFMAVVKITVKRNGPYRVEAPEGSIELVDADGQKYDLTGKPAFSLCRCGGSVTKPFCDGTHSRIGFQGAESAVKKADNP
jgi:CDGSH-type Zn-finger protein